MSVHKASIAIEPFTLALAQELLPLGQKCFDESTHAKAAACAFHGSREFAIEPDWEQYLQLASTGALILFVLRHDGESKGYALGWTYRTLHHKHILGAIVDTFYLEPEYRALASVLVDLFIEELTRRQVQIVGWPTTWGSSVHSLLTAQGFIGDDIVMEKRLCV